MRHMSRKFLVTLASLLLALAVIFHPDRADWLERTITKVAALATTILTVLRYVKTEGEVDVARAKQGDPTTEVPAQ